MTQRSLHQGYGEFVFAEASNFRLYPIPAPQSVLQNTRDGLSPSALSSDTPKPLSGGLADRGARYPPGKRFPVNGTAGRGDDVGTD